MKKTIIFVLVTILLSTALIAWDTNPLYDPFEVIWNAITDLEKKDDLAEFSYLLNQMDSEMEIPFDALQPIDCSDSSLTLTLDSVTFSDVIGFVGHEDISRPYEYYVAFQTTSSVILPSYVGKMGKLWFIHEGNSKWFTGMISEIGLASYDGSTRIYVVKLVPRLHNLSYDSGYKIYQSDSIPDVINNLMSSNGLGSYSWFLYDSYPNRNYVVQYGETEFDFFSRLIEEEGIMYYFTHSSIGEYLIFTDDNSGSTNPSYNTQTYRGHMADPAYLGEDYVRTFHLKMAKTVGRIEVDSYDFTRPTYNLMRLYMSSNDGRQYHFFSGLPDGAITVDRARTIFQRLHTTLHTGTATSPDIRAGHAISLTDTVGSIDGTYLLTSVRHAAIKDGSCYLYGNEFEAVSYSQDYRPEQITPMPVAYMDTGYVTAPSGEERYVDEYGRIKVHFHWDEFGATDETSSAWIRLMTPFDGTHYENITLIPTAGTEVIIGYEQGDPDRPIVLGTVYNNDNMPPFPLPDRKDNPYYSGSCYFRNTSVNIAPGAFDWRWIYCDSSEHRAVSCGTYTPNAGTETVMSGYIYSDTSATGQLPSRCLVSWKNDETLTKTFYGYATCCPKELVENVKII